MAVNEKELYIAHTLDVAWIIALWHWIHGGDPARDGEVAQTTELMARALVGHMSSTSGKTETAKDVIEKLGKLGIKMVMKEDVQQTEVKSTKQFEERFFAGTQGGQHPIIPCGVVHGFEVCSGPIWFQQIQVRGPHGPR